MNKSENILILGAGLMQKPAILAGKNLGFNVVVIDANPNAVCVPLADRFEKIDLKDKEGILNFAKELNIDNKLKAVFTAGTDFSASVSYVTEKLNLFGHSFEAATNASNKTLMRKCFLQNELPSPKYFFISQEQLNSSDLQNFAKELNFPFVVKPADNMGARGCRIVRDSSELLNAVTVAIKNSRSGIAILEEYMEGDEYSIDALVYNGTMTITGFADRHIFYPPYFIEMGHTMPTNIEENKRLELISTFALGVQALGLTHGAAKADIKYTPNGPMIGEIAARLSGGYMSGWTFPYSSDCNLTQEALLIACGKVPELLEKNRISVKYVPSEACKNKKQPFELYELPCNGVSAERAWISIPGKLKDWSNNVKSENIKNVFPRITNALDELDFPRNNVEKCGNVISLAQTRNEAIFEAENAISNIFLRLDSNNAKTEEFLSDKNKSDESNFPPPAFEAYNIVKNIQFSGVIPQNEPAEKHIPDEIKNMVNSVAVDWNYLTVLQTIKKFDTICKNHSEINANRFWKALFKGGIQAIVYVADSSSENNI